MRWSGWWRSGHSNRQALASFNPSVPQGVVGADAATDFALSTEEFIGAKEIEDILRVEETTTAEFFAGDLFRRRFGSPAPDYPRHFVAYYRRGRANYWTVGYIHYSQFEDSFLCGGMVIDDRLYRRMPSSHRSLIRDVGGIAEFMLRATFGCLANAPAIWGYVGDKQAEAVDLRVGFQHTRHPHVMVVWNKELSSEEKSARLARVIALGPF